jgi:ribonuclease J
VSRDRVTEVAAWDAVPAADELYLVPLGGTGEIGMNLNLYGHDGAWLMVDLGVTFAGDELPGIDLVMPDTDFIEARKDRLAGLILTHAHEDHIGAVPYLWPRLRCPIYATPFTAYMLRGKLKEAGLLAEAEIIEIALSGRFSVGPFQIELITLTHSIPEPNAVVIRTAAGSVLHTGDWKLDPDPLIGDDYDKDRLQDLAEEGVLAVVCDSTNALVEGETGSEAEVREELMARVRGLKGRVVIACFASNVARLDTAIRVAVASGRRVALVGRSMHRIVEAARETGYLKDLPPFVAEDEVDYLPREEVLLLATGSQGEKRAALWRIAQGQHPSVALDEGDTVIFSSRVIPGNELGIFALQNALVERGIKVVNAKDNDIHVSGHPARGELAQMYNWVRPKISVPVHGEARHLAAHAELAAACQVPRQIVCRNGAVVRLAPGPGEVVGEVPTGRLLYDGGRLLAAGNLAQRARQRMAYNGSAMITLVVDSRGALEADPCVSLEGLLDLEEDDDAEILDLLIDAVEAAVERLPRKRRSDEALEEAARLALRRTTNKIFGKKPVTQVHLVRL